MRLLHASLLAACALPGCAASQAAVQSSLDTAIKAQEVTQSGEVLDIPTEGIAEVDVNSSVVLSMNPDVIRKAAPAPPGQHAQALKLTGDLKLVSEALDAQLAAVKATKQLQDTPAAPLAEMQAVGKLQLAAVSKVRALVESRGGKPGDLYSEAGYDKVVAYITALKAEHEQLLAQIDARTWRVRASLRTSARSEPVHLANYDALSNGNLDVKNKLVPVVDDAVLAELKQAQAASEAARNLDGFLKLLEADAQKRLDALGDYLTTVLTEAARDVDQLALVQSKQAQAAALVAKAKSTVEAFKSASSSCRPLVDKLAKVDKKKPLSLVPQLAPLVPVCREALTTLATSADATKAEAQRLLDTAELRELAKQVQDLLVGITTDKLNPAALEAVLGLSSLSSNAQPARWAAEADFRDLPLGAIVDTRIELTTTAREAGDFVTYQGLIRDRKEDATLAEGPLRSLRVVNAGMHLDVSAALIFVQPAERADNEDPFRGAPAVTGAFHYYCARRTGETQPRGGCALWNGLNPGLGAHVATLTLGKVHTDPASGSQRAESVETPHIGVAAVVQLFGDVAQAGAGYDFQAGRAYWFVGVGIQTLTKLGFKFGL